MLIIMAIIRRKWSRHSFRQIIPSIIVLFENHSWIPSLRHGMSTRRPVVCINYKENDSYLYTSAGGGLCRTWYEVGSVKSTQNRTSPQPVPVFLRHQEIRRAAGGCQKLRDGLASTRVPKRPETPGEHDSIYDRDNRETTGSTNQRGGWRDQKKKKADFSYVYYTIIRARDYYIIDIPAGV